MKTDIQIAQEAVLLPITQIAEKLDISADDLELYGKYKAKLTKEFIKKWVMEGPTHHYALGVGHHADTIAKIAEILGIEYVIVK